MCVHEGQLDDITLSTFAFSPFVQLRFVSILSEDTLLESGTLFKKNFQSRSLATYAASSTQCPNFRGLFT